MKQMKQTKQKSNIFNSNKIHLNNKYIRNDKELLNLLKFILMIRKKKRSNKQKMNKYSDAHRNAVTSPKITSSINEVGEIKQHNPIHILPQSHNINQYRMIENELTNMRNQINQNNRKNSLPTIENKHDPSINWTHHNNDAIELIRKVAVERDPDAAKKLVDAVPEFKNMMSDLHELGASSAKDYIKGLEKDIYALNEKRSYLEENNNKLNYEIEVMQSKLHDIESEKENLENKIDTLEDDLNYKSDSLTILNKSNQDIQNQNYQLLEEIERNKTNIDELEKLYQSTKTNLDNIILEEQNMNDKISQMNDVINEKHKEIELLNELKEQAEEKADEEYNIRKQAEEGLKEISKVKKQLAKENVNINRSLRLEQINNMKRTELLKVLKIQDVKKPYISADQLKTMLIEKEGLNITLATPPSTPEKIEDYMNTNIRAYV